MSDKPGTVPSTPLGNSHTSQQFTGHTNAQHGGPRLAKEGPKYENPEVADLYERIKKAFKELGHEF